MSSEDYAGVTDSPTSVTTQVEGRKVHVSSLESGSQIQQESESKWDALPSGSSISSGVIRAGPALTSHKLVQICLQPFIVSSVITARAEAAADGTN